jgi:cell filamentation protein
MSPDEDPYTYPGTNVLRNNFDIRDAHDLRETEYELTQQRLLEPLPEITLTTAGYQNLHRHIFGDLYPWAGELRTVNIAKDGSLFAIPQFLRKEMDNRFDAMRADVRLVSTKLDEFIAGAAEHINEINARHPFREGNGRTQRALLEVIARRAGYRLLADKIKPDAWMQASIAGFRDADHQPMCRVLRDALEVDQHVDVPPASISGKLPDAN